MSLFRLLAVVCLFPLIGCNSLTTENDTQLTFIHLNTDVNPISKPVQPTNVEGHSQMYYSGIITEDDAKRVWYFNESEAWFFSLVNKIWTKHSTLEGLSGKDYVVYNPQLNQFVFWSSDGSSISTWKIGESSLKNVTQTTDQKLLKNHTGFIDPISGQIYSLGGRGYGVDSGLMWSLNEVKYDWEMVSINSSHPPPSGRINPSTVVSGSDRKVHLFGGNSFRDGRLDLSKSDKELWDYWTYDFDQSIWSQKKIYGISSENYHTKPEGTYRNRRMNGLWDAKNELIWFHFKGRKNVTHSLVVFDIKSDHGINIPVSLLDHINKPIIRHMSLDPVTNDLVLFWSPWVSSENQSVLNVSTAKLPNADSIRSLMDEARLLDQKAERKEVNRILPALPNESLLLLVIISFLSVFVYKSKWIRKKHTIQNPNRLPANLNIIVSERPRIYINDNALDQYLTKRELNLVTWLSCKYYAGLPFQLTDVIEEFFFSDFDNHDFSRKQRNIAFKNINEVLLKLLSDYSDRKEYIIVRNTKEDKRKREYAVDLDGVHIVINLLPSSSEENGVKRPDHETWIEDILKDLSSLKR